MKIRQHPVYHGALECGRCHFDTGRYRYLFPLNKRPDNDPGLVQQPSSDTPGINDPILKEINPGYAKEVYHFTQLIELKQNELKEIEKENPNLYKKFVGDINTLDSSYNALKKELPENPNREQLLEAMIENLRLQTDSSISNFSLLNKSNQQKATIMKAILKEYSIPLIFTCLLSSTLVMAGDPVVEKKKTIPNPTP